MLCPKLITVLTFIFTPYFSDFFSAEAGKKSVTYWSLLDKCLETTQQGHLSETFHDFNNIWDILWASHTTESFDFLNVNPTLYAICFCIPPKYIINV